MKKKIVIAVIIVALLCGIGGCVYSCWRTFGYSDERTVSEAQKFVKDELGYDEVWFVCMGYARIEPEYDFHPSFLVFGIKDGEEILAAIPFFKSDKEPPVIMDWPFKHSFAQIVDFLHENDIDCEKKDYGAFSLENRPENGSDTIKPEPRLGLVYHNYCVTETDGNLILI